MIFLLDIILGINLWWAYKTFKNIFSPPILVGLGMFIASLVATSYYTEWEMDRICFKTVFFIGGGTLFQRETFTYDMFAFKLIRIKVLLICLIILGILTCYLKIREYGLFYGNSLQITELLYAKRMDEFEESDFKLPKYIVAFSFIITVFSSVVAWILSVFLLMPQKNKQIITL